MTNLMKLLAAAATAGSLAAPVAAQNPYPYAYPNQGYAYPNQGYAYPNQGYAYPNQQYGYQQGYGSNPIGQIIDQLLGNRYNVTDRQAVSQCASAAMAQAAAQYGQNRYNGYNGGNGYNGYNGYSAAANFRVTAISDVQRRSNGLRVTGLMSSGGGYGNQGYAYGNRANGQLNFRCNVDYRGAVTNVRVRPNNY